MIRYIGLALVVGATVIAIEHRNRPPADVGQPAKLTPLAAGPTKSPSGTLPSSTATSGTWFTTGTIGVTKNCVSFDANGVLVDSGASCVGSYRIPGTYIDTIAAPPEAGP